MATLIWKLADYPLPEHVDQLDRFLQEAKNLNPDGTPKLRTPKKSPKKRKASLKETSEPKKKK